MARCRMQTCASCREFPINEAEQSAGRATCTMYEQPRDFDDVACVLYDPDTECADARKRIAITLTRKKDKKPS